MVYIGVMEGTLAARVLLSRRDLGINQDELAKRAGISRTYVSKIETGAVKDVMSDVVIGLAMALGVSVSYLLGLTDVPSDDPGTPLQSNESLVIFEIKDRLLRRDAQELMALFVEMAPEDRTYTIGIVERIWRSAQHEPRIIGS